VAVLTPQAITRAGLAPAFSAAAGGGDQFLPDADTWIVVRNAGGSPITATVTTFNTDRLGNTVADNAISVPATTGERWIGPFPATEYADPTDGLADIAYSGVTSVTVGVFKVTKP